MDRDSALWKNVKDKLYPDGLIRGKEGEKKRQQLAEIDAEYAKEQKKVSDRARLLAPCKGVLYEPVCSVVTKRLCCTS